MKDRTPTLINWCIDPAKEPLGGSEDNSCWLHVRYNSKDSNQKQMVSRSFFNCIRSRISTSMISSPKTQIDPTPIANDMPFWAAAFHPNIAGKWPSNSKMPSILTPQRPNSNEGRHTTPSSQS